MSNRQWTEFQLRYQKHTSNLVDQINRDAYRYGGTYKKPFGPVARAAKACGDQ
jgi:hypothetical protein